MNLAQQITEAVLGEESLNEWKQAVDYSIDKKTIQFYLDDLRRLVSEHGLEGIIVGEKTVEIDPTKPVRDRAVKEKFIDILRKLGIRYA